MSDYPTIELSDDVKASLRAGESKATTGMQLKTALPGSESLQTRASTGTPMTVLRYAQEVIRDGAVGYWPMRPTMVDGVDQVPIAGVHPYIVDPPAPPAPEVSPLLALLIADGATHVWPLEENTATNTFADVVGTVHLVSSPRQADAMASAPIGPAGVASPLTNGVGSIGDGSDATKDSLWSASANLGAAVGDLTVETFFKATASPGALLRILCGIFAADLASYAFVSIDSTGVLSGGMPGSSLASVGSVIDDVVHLATLIRASGLTTLLLDGVVQASASYSTPQNFSAARAQMAMLDYGGAKVYGYAGQLAYGAYFPLALTPTQVLAHYTTGTA